MIASTSICRVTLAETVPSFAESWRTVQKIHTLQRLWWSLPFLATALIGFVTLAALLYEQQFDLDERARRRPAPRVSA